MSAYSNTPLAKKLGIKSGDTIWIGNEPENYLHLFNDFPEDVKWKSGNTGKLNFIQYFIKERIELIKVLPLLKNQIHPNGIIWISWPKKSSKVLTDVTEDVIREVALKNDLVDVKVCAIDDVWSGLKLVIPLSKR